MRNRYQRLLADPAELDARLANGERHAASAPIGHTPEPRPPWASSAAAAVRTGAAPLNVGDRLQTLGPPCLLLHRRERVRSPVVTTC